MKSRHLILGVALVLSAALMLSDRLSSQSPATVVAAAERLHAQISVSGPVIGKMGSATPAVLALEGRQAPLEGERTVHQALFAVRSWAPPPVEVLSEPATNSAPPLPFGYAGKVREHGKWTVFLTRDEEILAVKEGDKIDHTYWVKSVKPPKMEIVYGPLVQSQEMNIE